MSTNPTAGCASERALLGALMLLPLTRVQVVLRTIEDEDLADPHLRIILGAIRRLAGNGAPTDVVAIQAHLRSTGHVSTASMGNLSLLLAELVSVDTVPLPEAVDTYASAVVEEAVRRQLVELSAGVQDLAQQGPRERIPEHVSVLTSLMVAATRRLDRQSLAGVS